MTLLARWLSAVGVVALAAALAPGFEGGGPVPLIGAAIAIGAVLAAVRPLVSALPFPVPMIALAVFYVLLNGSLLWLATTLIPGFGFAGSGGIAVAALLIAVVTMFLHAAAGRRGRADA